MVKTTNVVGIVRLKGEKVLGQEGNSPDRLLKFLMRSLLKKIWNLYQRKSRLRNGHLLMRAFKLIFWNLSEFIM